VKSGESVRPKMATAVWGAQYSRVLPFETVQQVYGMPFLQGPHTEPAGERLGIARWLNRAFGARLAQMTRSPGVTREKTCVPRLRDRLVGREE